MRQIIVRLKVNRRNTSLQQSQAPHPDWTSSSDKSTDRCKTRIEPCGGAREVGSDLCETRTYNWRTHYLNQFHCTYNSSDKCEICRNEVTENKSCYCQHRMQRASTCCKQCHELIGMQMNAHVLIVLIPRSGLTRRIGVARTIARNIAVSIRS